MHDYRQAAVACRAEMGAETGALALARGVIVVEVEAGLADAYDLVVFGEFNQARLRVEGNRVTQWLNGAKVVEYRLWTDEWKQKVAASKFGSMPKYGLNKTGHLAIQDHGNEIWFRNIKVRRLEN